MARCVLSSAGKDTRILSLDERSSCIELVMVLSARLTAIFSRFGMIVGIPALFAGTTTHIQQRPSQLFASGKYGLFESKPSKLGLGQRKYLCLFLATLFEQQVTDLVVSGLLCS
jgi:hypothetical protein